MFKLYKKLKYIKYNLKEWNKEIFGNINQEKKNIEERMRILQELCIDEGYTEDQKREEIQMIQEWEARCKKEETLWCQNSRIRWLKEGERNPKFFHETTIARRSHNKILKIRDQRESHHNIENTLVKSLLRDSQRAQPRQFLGHTKDNSTHPQIGHRGSKC